MRVPLIVLMLLIINLAVHRSIVHVYYSALNIQQWINQEQGCVWYAVLLRKLSKMIKQFGHGSHFDCFFLKVCFKGCVSQL